MQHQNQQCLLIKSSWGVNLTGAWLIDYFYHEGYSMFGKRNTECLCDNNGNPDIEKITKSNLQNSSTKLD